MEAIATLVVNDPYLEQSKDIRIAARHARRARIAAQGKPELATIVSEIVPLPDFDFNNWLARQDEINPLPKQRWFSVEEDLGPVEPMRPSIHAIRRVVSVHSGISEVDILSIRRTAPVVRARQIAMYLCKILTIRSLPDIGRRFGNRDHTTVLHAVRKLERLVRTDVELAAEVEALKASILA